LTFKLFLKENQLLPPETNTPGLFARIARSSKQNSIITSNPFEEKHSTKEVAEKVVN